MRSAPSPLPGRSADGNFLDQALSAERERLVRLCARLTGDREAAEDLAQEALLEGWRHQERLYGATLWKAYLTGIARNVCLRWCRKQGRERRMVTLPAGLESVADEEATGGGEARDADPVEDLLVRAELSALLERAMASLPEDSRALLTERYVDNLPQAEIAARRRMTEGCAGVRLHRSRAALRRALESRPELREDAAAHGLLGADALEGWQSTRIWCPHCGAAFLDWRFERDAAGRCRSFAVRCRDCREELGADFTTRHRALDPGQLLSDVKGCKPALTRLSRWWSDLLEQAVATRESLCARCGGKTWVTTDPPSSVPLWMREMRGIYSLCAPCQRPLCLTPAGRAFHTPEARRFWQRHPRMRLRSERDLMFQGQPAVAVTLESVTDCARLECILSRANFAVLSLEETGAGSAAERQPSLVV